MSFESGIVARLNAVTAVTDLTGARIFADILPDGEGYPAIVYQIISNFPFDSVLSSDGGKFVARVQFTLLDDNKLGIIALNNALRTAMQRFQGTADDVTILDSRIENEFDQEFDRETKVTERICDYTIYYE